MTRGLLPLLIGISALCSPAWAADAEAEPAPAAPATAAPATGPLSIEEAVARPIAWGPALSPSGRYLALISATRQGGKITIADLQDESAKPFIYEFARGEIRWVDWKTDERLLFAAARQWRNWHLRRLYAIDRDGKNPAMMFDGNELANDTVELDRVTDFLRNDPQHILMPALRYQSLDLYRVDVRTGASEVVAKGNPATVHWYTNKDGQPAFRADHNWSGSSAYLYVRKGPGNVGPGNFEWDKFLTFLLKSEVYDATPAFEPYFPGPEPNSFYVVARPDGADTSGIYLYDFAEKKYLKTLATEPGIDIDRPIIHRHTFEYRGTHYYADRQMVRLVNRTHQAHLNALDKYFGGEVDVYLYDRDRADETWVLYTTGPRDRGSWHLYRVKDRFVKQIQHEFPVVDAKRLGTTKVLRYKARDGVEIMGYLTTPPSAPKDGPAPLVMYPHGGPEARDRYQFEPMVQLLASRGYQVFQPNFRGSSGFGERFADSGKGQWGRAMQDDLTDGFEFLVKNGYAVPGRACIVGASYGGYAALAAATQTPDLYRCAVSLAGISDLARMLKSDKTVDEPLYEYMKRQIGDPKKDAATIAAHSPVRSVDAVRVPVLLIHGTLDKRVPVEQSQIMDEALRKAGKQVSYVEIERAGHNLYADAPRKTFPPILDFLQQHLPVAPAK